MRYYGIIDHYDDRRGYGYILPDQPDAPDERYLVHRYSLRDRSSLLLPGTRVSFSKTLVPTGTLASDVSRIEEYVDDKGSPQEEIIFNDEVDSPSRLGGNLSSDMLAQAILARDARKLDRAAEIYEQALLKCPSIQIVLSYASMEKNRNRRQKAMGVYQAGIELFPTNVKLREDAGNLAVSMKQFDRAVRFFEGALDLCRSRNQAGVKGVLLNLARVHYQKDSAADLRQASTYYEQVHKIFEAEGRRAHVPQIDTLQMNLSKIRTQHQRGALAFRYLTQVGFLIKRADLDVQITRGADLVVEFRNQELSESYGIASDLLVRCTFQTEVTRQDLDNIDERVKTWGASGLVDEQIVLLVLGSMSVNLQALLLRRIEDRKRLVPAIVPVLQHEMEDAQVPLDSFREILDRWLYRRDLFSLNSPVSGRRFFGRDRSLAQLRDAIANGASAGVFGLRKVGKTSLLKETERRAIEFNDVAVYLDLLTVPADVEDAKWLYWKIATNLHVQSLRLGLRGLKWRLGGAFQDYLDIPSGFPVATAFDSDLTMLLQNLRNAPINPKPKIVLLLDEVERLLPNELGKPGFIGFFDFIGYLRGVSQENPDFILIVTGANASISETAQFSGRDNPAFNFLNEIYLPLLDENECAIMIRALGKGMGLRFTPNAISEVYNLTGGHPFFARQLCSFVVSRHSERPLDVTDIMVGALVNEYIEFNSEDFLEITERLKRDYPEEMRVVERLAATGRGLPINELGASMSTGALTIKHLVGYQLVRIDKNQAYLSMDLFKRWLARHLEVRGDL